MAINQEPSIEGCSYTELVLQSLCFAVADPGFQKGRECDQICPQTTRSKVNLAKERALTTILQYRSHLL